ncbi:MAG: glycoside hydrolase family 3 protein [Clostridiales bacterium]|nr:glycoside hydrolase family 3 protein [Clostridiales bacterium]
MDNNNSTKKEKKKKDRKIPVWYNMIRGFSVLCAFLCALLIGAYSIGNISDYTVLINNALGVNTSSAGNADAYGFTSDYESTVDMLTERQRIAEQIGEEGCVLLKNEGNALPLRQGDGGGEVKVTVLGSRAYTYDKSGGLRDSSLAFYGGIVGSPIRRQTVTTKNGKISLPVTIEAAFKNQNIIINPTLINTYSDKNFPSLVSGSEANGSSGAPFAINEPSITLNECGQYQAYSDACFVVVGRSSGEGREYLPGPYGVGNKSDGSKSAIGLSDGERNLISVASQISDKVIVLINSAVAMEIDELKYNDKVDAVLWIGLPGSYGMNGVARVISGAASPSGKLPDTYAVDASASPAAQNFGITSPNGGGRDSMFIWSDTSRYDNADNSHYVVLAEGLYTGYYYYETRYADAVEGRGNASSGVGKGYGATTSNWKYEDEVSYTFGYGLSYSSFTQEIVDGSLKVDLEKKTASVDVLVKNTGKRTAKTVVELFAQSPYTDYDIAHGVEKSAVQLVSFEKAELEPDEERTVTVPVSLKYLASYDKTVSNGGAVGGYILENGNYYFAVGNGAHDALNSILLKKGVERDKLYVEDGEDPSVNRAVVWNPSESGVGFDGNGVNVSLFSVTDSGKTVSNRLSDADYNFFNPNTVTYLSRSDWAGTFPKSYVRLDVPNNATFTLYLDSRVYQFTTGKSNVEFGVDHTTEEDDEGNPLENLSVADMKFASYDDERWDYLISQITFDEAWRFAPYGGSSCKLFKSVNAPEVWQIDGPNGNVTRSIGSKSPSSGVMAVPQSDPNYDYMSCDMCCEPMTAATFNKELLEEQGKIYGEDMLWSRNPIIWAPGMNLHRTPFNSRNHEYYSEDPMLTNILGVSFVRGGLSKGAMLSAKHFAFNTQESYREGLCQFMEEQSARELELRAFQGLSEDVNYVNASGNTVNAIGLMSSFSRVGACGVNAHTGLMKNILRGEWGYKGMISTDMVVGGRFFNPQDAVINNVTFMATSNAESLLTNFWPDYNNKNKVKNDPALCEALYENMHYYMYSLANSSALNGYDSNTVVTEEVYFWQKALYGGAIALGVVCGVLAVLAVVLRILRNNKLKNAVAAEEPTDSVQDALDAIESSLNTISEASAYLGRSASGKKKKSTDEADIYEPVGEPTTRYSAEGRETGETFSSAGQCPVEPTAERAAPQEAEIKPASTRGKKKNKKTADTENTTNEEERI